MLSKINFLEKLNQILLNENLVEKEKERLERVIKHSDLLPEDISANILIEKLGLETIKGVTDEDGYYREFVNTIDNEDQENQTEIFYLLKGKQVSCLHILDTTETWRWLGGNEISIFIFKKQELEKITLNENNLFYTIEKGLLFGAKLNNLKDDKDFGLVTCLCKPGFILKHYSNPSLEELTILKEKYPEYTSDIDELTANILCKSTHTDELATKASIYKNSKNNFFWSMFSFCANCIGIKKTEEQNSLISPQK